MNIKIRIKSIPWKVSKPFCYVDMIMDGLAEITSPVVTKPMNDQEAIRFDWECVGDDLKKAMGLK